MSVAKCKSGISWALFCFVIAATIARQVGSRRGVAGSRDG